MNIGRLALLAGVASAAMATSAFAQDASGEADAAQKSDAEASASAEDIVVTGSRVITNGNAMPMPVTVVTSDALLKTTPSNLVDALNKLPGFVNSPGSNSNSVSTGNYLNLRGFGANRNLVLLDGHRLAPTATDGSVNVDVMPKMLIKRVDVATAGVSAVYGSDAISGAVNFITDQKFEGLKLEASKGISSRGDAPNWRVGVAGGTSFAGGRGHIIASYEHFDQAGLFDKNARPNGSKVYVLQVDDPTQPPGTSSNPFRLVENGRFAPFAFPGAILSGPFAGYVFDGQGGVRPENVLTDGWYGKHTGITTSLRTDQAFGRIDFDITDNLKFHAQGNWAKSRNVGNFFPFFVLPLVITPDNPFLPAAVRASGVPFVFGKSIDGERFNLQTRQHTKSWTASTGLEAKLGQFVAKLDYDHGEASSTQAFRNNGRLDHLIASLDAVDQGEFQTGVPNGNIVCRAAILNPGSYGDCIPWNAFGADPNTQTAAIDYIQDESFQRTSYRMDVVQGSIAGPIFDGWAGPVSVALSAEHRALNFNYFSLPGTADLADCNGLPAFNCTQGVTAIYQGGVIAPIDKTEKVNEVAFEFELPLLKDVAFAKAVNLNGAIRRTHYSTSGSVTTWKIGGDWNISDDFRIRATRSRDIRAPSLFELFQPLSFGTTGYTDLHTGGGGVVAFYNGGNPDLKPEISNTWTVGFVATPSVVPGLSVSVDYYTIKLANAISLVSGIDPAIQKICEDSNGTSSYCSLYTRPLPFSDHSLANTATAVFAKVFNTAELKTSGVDADISYGFNAAGGRIALRALVGYQPTFESKLAPGFQTLLGIGNGIPKWRVTAYASYSNDDWSIDVQERWRSSLKWDANPTVVYALPDIPSVAYTDLTFTANVMNEEHTGRSLQVYFSVQNLFDKQPPVYTTAGAAGTPGFQYPARPGDDVIGRYFTAGVRVKM